jgi:hypothetical protein
MQYQRWRNKMSIKKAVDKDASADRPTRPTPTHREPVQYNCNEARSETNPDYTKPQFERKHELATDKNATKAGAILAGKVGDGCVEAAEDGFANAKRRAAHVMAKRKETEKAFEALRPTVAGTRKRLGR